ncbi:MAG: hypothetical protein AVDCRST_MAG22-855 [uncultured Rubrobacteraceae bacterium]|uniref:Uncharacterized protein n=1 Tax=uncultured Rubrobacteraceae bacterium TaxID=349277 RepID=A0A6J4NTQ9_9ACTN|nr:MAG: hypothetical protein AVDCRST_MAG22-855 [uncultured Rubrobacteraceae bacterium]
MRDSTEATEPRPLRCPFCGFQGIEHRGHHVERCSRCEALLGHEILKTLRQITELPDAVGRHACECGHPEMVRLPGGIFHCPACRSEVLPLESFLLDPPDRARMDEKLEIG